MPAKTRTFTPAELEAIGVPFECYDEDDAVPGFAVELSREQVGTSRWSSVHRLVFRAPDDGKAYAVRYKQGLTEYQDDVDPWDDEDEIGATEVEAREVIVIHWLPVEA